MNFSSDFGGLVVAFLWDFPCVQNASLGCFFLVCVCAVGERGEGVG